MNITVTENVSAVTFNNVPLYKTIMEDTLTAVAEAGINIDMISMTAPTSERFGFGFTLDDDTEEPQEEINLMPGTNSSLQGNGELFSGEYLMTVGLNIFTGQRLNSRVIEVVAE